jgi:lipid II isoglutaminyl synthase (glutamine-hydrolysing)
VADGDRWKAFDAVIRLMMAISVGRVAARLTKLLGRGGSAVPGLVAMRIAPDLVERLAATVRDGLVIVTGTNGKTTTTKMITAALTADGRRLVTNRSGSNLERGIASALIDRASWRGAVDADTAVFEADEAAVGILGPRLSPHLMVVTNLARDQLDRYGELDTAAAHIAVAAGHAGHLVLNADDPPVSALASGSRASYYGAVPHIRSVMPSDRELHGADLDVERPELAVEVIDMMPEGFGQIVVLEVDGHRQTLRLQVPGAYNAYNAAAAVTAATHLGVSREAIWGALEAMKAPFGRGQVVDYRGRRVVVVLAKNPAGLNQAIRLVTGAIEPSVVIAAINDEIADGRDVSWLWDARVEELATSEHRFMASGTRAADMALRFKYAGVDASWDPDLGRALDRAVDSVGEGDTVYVVPTYTAMLALLDLLLPGVPRSEVWM